MSIPFPPGARPSEKTPAEIEKEKRTKTFILNKTLEPHRRHDEKVLHFIDAYLHYRSVSEASRQAGIALKDGNRLYKRHDVFDAIAQLNDVALEKYGYNAGEVVERVKSTLNFDPAVVENPDGTYKEKLSDIPFEDRMAIKKFVVKNEYGMDANGIRTVTGKIITVEVESRMKAAEMLGPEKDVFKPTLDLNQNVRISIVGALAAADQRVAIAAAEARDVTEIESKDVI